MSPVGLKKDDTRVLSNLAGGVAGARYSYRFFFTQLSLPDHQHRTVAQGRAKSNIKTWRIRGEVYMRMTSVLAASVKHSDSHTGRAVTRKSNDGENQVCGSA